MARIALTGGAYQARSVIASAQRCVNLYPETNPGDSQQPVPVVHYPTPGLRRLADGPQTAAVRCLYTATNGDLYAAIGKSIYYVAPDWTLAHLGDVLTNFGPVSMADNGLVILAVDGSASGCTIDMQNGRAFGYVNDAAFYGGDRVQFLDTYFVLNRPDTTQFYISLSEVTASQLGGTVAPDTTYAAFDPLDIAAKSGSADPIVALIAVHRELLLIGVLTTEVWANTGSSDFTFGEVPGTYIEHGCAAPGSVAAQDVSAFWLSKDRQGQGIVVKYAGYQAQRISTHAIEAEFQGYRRIDDALGYTFQQEGHAFYVITFPTADKTWAYELQTQQWHELAWSDDNGVLHRHRANVCAFAYGTNVAGDWQNGRLYALDPAIFDDDGAPRQHIRTFPHLLNDGRRVSYDRMIADIQTGTQVGGQGSAPPQISLRWSNDRGASYGNPVLQPMGATGDYRAVPTWNRLGMARDRVFELSWSAAVRTALNGAFIETSPCES